MLWCALWQWKHLEAGAGRPSQATYFVNEPVRRSSPSYPAARIRRGDGVWLRNSLYCPQFAHRLEQLTSGRVCCTWRSVFASRSGSIGQVLAYLTISSAGAYGRCTTRTSPVGSRWLVLHRLTAERTPNPSSQRTAFGSRSTAISYASLGSEKALGHILFLDGSIKCG